MEENVCPREERVDEMVEKPFTRAAYHGAVDIVSFLVDAIITLRVQADISKVACNEMNRARTSKY